MSDAEIRLNLISMPCWTYKEIMAYTNTNSKTTAIKIKNRATNLFGGKVPYGSQYVKTDSVLQLFGSSREEELKLLKELLNEEELQKVNPNR